MRRCSGLATRLRRLVATEHFLFPKSQVKNRKSTKKPNRFVRRNRRISLFFKGRNLASLDAVHPPSFATLTAGGGGARFARALELSLFSSIRF